MSLHTPKEIAAVAVESGVVKSRTPVSSLLILGFLAGAFIAFGFLLYIHVVNQLPAEWGSFGTLLGAAVFPVGIIITVLAGGELLTGNMMVMPVAWFARQISALSVMRNWFWVTVANFIGSVAIAWFFGHMLGMTEGDYLKKTVAIASAKVNADFMHAFISGVGCNWLVCLATWLAFASKDVVGKIFGMWFPVMAFVAIGFQHVVANMFIVPAAIFAGYLSWGEYLPNFIAVFLGNAVGGAIFVGLAYFVAFRAPQPASSTSR
ncbi:formate/nitrite transporter [bacteria symbiont BFo1 of Frankliniella occidentalis]|jgi:formate/nitrite transporter|uniref:Formate/nitrite transporter family protein n=1 Tax=Erwinia aphidicola TaxID=68334 RepID=A0ABU8DFN4_ERWAP|nr:formate/nitrite transporter family protein [Erwinia aphidicola]KMV71716.1 formate/nitrite transporter [bacteria symbiont BFo1 of Frankliniella occidentalis]KYP85768.1 formate/nitrite transporter [bacteria symbiont BFo1 of Frankliniella occidentalis]MBD1375809.1 formate/nitrite transporter family protein [Erwinia aphidicola]CAH0201598.1 putative formate transporter 1 [Erwinia aphidicola]